MMQLKQANKQGWQLQFWSCKLSDSAKHLSCVECVIFEFNGKNRQRARYRDFRCAQSLPFPFLVLPTVKEG